MVAWLNLLRPSRVDDKALPASVEAALAGLSAVPRPDHEGQARVLLQWPGDNAGAWHHSPQPTRERLRAAFPGLSEAQLAQCLRAIAGIIHRAQAANPAPSAKRWSAGSWAPRTYDQIQKA